MVGLARPAGGILTSNAVTTSHRSDRITRPWSARPEGGTHEPAIEYLEESFVVAPLNDVLSPKNLEWGEKHVGEFDRIEAVPDYIPVNGMRFTYKSHSFEGRGSRAWYPEGTGDIERHAPV